jgi:hypothetical protein
MKARTTICMAAANMYANQLKAPLLQKSAARTEIRVVLKMLETRNVQMKVKAVAKKVATRIAKRMRNPAPKIPEIRNVQKKVKDVVKKGAIKIAKKMSNPALKVQT